MSDPDDRKPPGDGDDDAAPQVIIATGGLSLSPKGSDTGGKLSSL